MARIVVGVDGSEGSRRALEWAVDEARLRSATVEALMAWHEPLVGEAVVATVGYDPELLEDATRAALGEVVDAVDASGLAAPIERVVARGGAAAALLKRAEGADLVVVGSRGHGGFLELVLGSVSHQVANHAPCPAVIVRRG
jgi:nucleotide-binding universal stress UspA family protein